MHVHVNKTAHCRSIKLVSHLQFPKGFFFRVRYTTDSERKNRSYSNKALNTNKTKIFVNLTVGRDLETEFVRGFGSENTDQRWAYFHLVAGTSPTNSSHSWISIICGDKSRGIVPRIQSWFEFVGQVAEFWSL